MFGRDTVRNEFKAAPGSDGDWEVRDRADVFVSAHASKREAQAAARKANEAAK